MAATAAAITHNKSSGWARSDAIGRRRDSTLSPRWRFLQWAFLFQRHATCASFAVTRWNRGHSRGRISFGAAVTVLRALVCAALPDGRCRLLRRVAGRGCRAYAFHGCRDERTTGNDMALGLRTRISPEEALAAHAAHAFAYADRWLANDVVGFACCCLRVLLRHFASLALVT
jgi:hypothetical protein